MRPLDVMFSRGPANGPANDPYFSSVVALLHFDGTNGSTAITDVKGKTWTALNGAQLDTSQFKFGTASCLFDGVNNVVTSPDNTDFEFGSGDFTLELWYRPTALTGANAYNGLIGKQTDSSTNCSYLLYFNQNNTGVVFQYTQDGVTRSFCSNGAALTVGQWHHLAVSRVGNNLWVFVDGVPGSAVNMAGVTIYGGTAAAIIGSQDPNGSTYVVNGHIDEVRITKGVGRYSSAFTPPSAPFPDS